MLGQRIALLESFLFEKVSKSLPNYMHYQRMMVNRFAPGKLTICDLTDVRAHLSTFDWGVRNLS